MGVQHICGSSYMTVAHNNIRAHTHMASEIESVLRCEKQREVVLLDERGISCVIEIAVAFNHGVV